MILVRAAAPASAPFDTAFEAFLVPEQLRGERRRRGSEPGHTRSLAEPG